MAMFAGHRPPHCLVCQKETPCAKIVMTNPAAGQFGTGSHRGPVLGPRASRPVGLGPWPQAGGAGGLSLQPTPRLEADGQGGTPEGPWPSATGPPGAAELHPFAGHRPLPRLVCQKTTT